MKNRILITGVLLIFTACHKNSDLLPPVITPHPYLNTYAGTYFGWFKESNNGVDSNGVFKTDTAYSFMVKITDGGIYQMTFRDSPRWRTIDIDKGPVILTSIPVDDSGRFVFEDFNREISGNFINDSLYINAKALNGSYNYPQWFVIQKLGFSGKKVP